MNGNTVVCNYWWQVNYWVSFFLVGQHMVFFLLLEPSRCVFTEYSKSKFSQNTSNLLSVKVATGFDSRNRHQVNY